MKKILIVLALCLGLLLPTGSAFAAGTAGDPLISLSHIKGSFAPEVMSAARAMLAARMEERFAGSGKSGAAPCLVTRSVAAGGSISLGTGQTVILLSGTARMEIGSGTVVNATVGLTAGSGGLNRGHRYIICENSSVTINVLSDAQVCASASATVTPGSAASPFTDIKASEWWYDDIVKAHQRGLVNGMTDTTFEPRGSLSTAQAVKLAACMHQLYFEGSVSLENSPSQPWYRSYVDYCLQKGIIAEEPENYSGAITRRSFVEIFHASLPESDYVAINSIPDGSIGDVSGSGGWVDDVYDFYRAGILTGYTADPKYKAHDFGPDSSISRAEVATILNRMFDHGARVRFSMD